AYAVVGGASGRNCRLHPSPLRPRDRSGREAHASSHSRDTSRSLACGCGLRRFVGLQRGHLLCWFCLSGELAADRRRHSAVTLARNQLVQHGGLAASADRCRMVKRPYGTHASYPPRKRGGSCLCPPLVLFVNPPLGPPSTAGAVWLCVAEGYLWGAFARHSSGGCTSDCAVH